MITSTAANLASAALECTLFGIFLVLSTISLVLLVRRRKLLDSSPNYLANSSFRCRMCWTERLGSVLQLAKSPLILANIVLILTVTAHWAMGIQRMFIGVVVRGGGQAAIDYYNDLQDKMEVARTAVLFVDMLTGDAVITYRTWLVWQRNYWAIVVPVLTIATLISFGIGLLHEFGTSSRGIFASAVGRWVTGYCAATLCTNLYGTIMIAYRIWSTNRELRKVVVLRGGRDLTSALAIFVESAALYSAWAVMFVILYATKSTLQTIGSGCGPTVIGIAFMLITVRVGLGWGQDSRPVTAQVSVLRSPVGRNNLQLRSDESFPMRPIALNVTQTVEQETDFALAQNELKTPQSAMLATEQRSRWS